MEVLSHAVSLQLANIKTAMGRREEQLLFFFVYNNYNNYIINNKNDKNII
jgi:hypothetical protein